MDHKGWATIDFTVVWSDMVLSSKALNQLILKASPIDSVATVFHCKCLLFQILLGCSLPLSPTAYCRPHYPLKTSLVKGKHQRDIQLLTTRSNI